MELEVRIRFDADCHADPAAALVVGSSPAEWLNVATRLGLETHRLQLLPLTHAATSECAEPFAALLIGSCDIARALREWSRVSTPVAGEFPPLPYRCIAGRLFVPLQSALSPPVSDTEWSSLLPTSKDDLLVWHPQSGLVQFELSQILTTTDLLGGPTVNGDVWDAAVQGDTLNDRLRSLSAIMAESPADIIEQGRGDIGKSSSELKDAPRSPDEDPHPRLTDARRTVKRFVARMVHGVTNSMPTAPGGSPLFARLHAWAEGIISGHGASGSAGGGAGRGKARTDLRLSAARENELKRLLNMLKTDPDTGLRFAIPYGGGSRGQAPASGRLGEHTPDFNLRALTGDGGPADLWDIPDVYRAQLFQSYRELAARETRLGNHRRAAYIHASLIGDLHAAANALVAGRFFHDAAVLYRKHLNQPLRAAECLREAGDWEEALTIYESHERWIEAGELWQQLGRPDAARDMFGREITACAGRRDYLRAGEIAEQRLNDPDEAAALLSQGWSAEAKPEQCLQALLNLNARRGRHDQSTLALRTLAGHPDNSRVLRELAVKVCADTSTQYPDVAVRDQARRQTWHLASSLLPDAPRERQQSALAAVSQLVRSDELLASDARRFLARQEERTSSKRRKPELPRTQVRNPQPAAAVAAIQIKNKAVLTSPRRKGVRKILRASVNKESCFVLFNAGHDRSVEVARFEIRDLATNGAVLLGCEPLSRSRPDSSGLLQFRSCPATPSVVYVQRLPGAPEWNAAMHEDPSPLSDFIRILPARSEHVLDFVVLATGDIRALVLGADGALELLLLSPSGEFRQSLTLSTMFDPWSCVDFEYDIDHFELLAWGGQLIIRTFNHLLRVPMDTTDAGMQVVDASNSRSVKTEVIIEFPLPIRSTAVSPEWTVHRVACAFENGVQVVWPESGSSVACGESLSVPAICFLNNGLLIARCSQTGIIEAYRLNNGRAVRVAQSAATNSSSELVGLFPAESPNEFFAIQTDGTLLQLSVPIR